MTLDQVVVALEKVTSVFASGNVVEDDSSDMPPDDGEE